MCESVRPAITTSNEPNAAQTTPSRTNCILLLIGVNSSFQSVRRLCPSYSYVMNYFELQKYICSTSCRKAGIVETGQSRWLSDCGHDDTHQHTILSNQIVMHWTTRVGWPFACWKALAFIWHRISGSDRANAADSSRPTVYYCWNLNEFRMHIDVHMFYVHMSGSHNISID